MDLSIIVPVFNRLDVLTPCLEALLAQLKDGDELLVIDDASDWPIREYLEELEKKNKNLCAHHLPVNKGQGFARNYGVSQAKKSILVFIDSDVQILEGGLEKIRQFFNLYPESAAVTGRLSLTHPYPSFFSRYKNAYMNFIFGLQSFDVNFLYGSICAIQKKDFIPWPERFLWGEDTELGMTLTKMGKKITFMSDLEVIHYKNYSLGSLIRNDFLIPFGFARSFWLFQGWRAYLPTFNKESESKFSHIQPIQVYSLLVVLLSIVGSYFFPWRTTLICFLIYLILNFRFFIFLVSAEGFVFGFMSIFWTFIDQLIMFLGAISGLIYHGVKLLMRPIFRLGESVEK